MIAIALEKKVSTFVSFDFPTEYWDCFILVSRSNLGNLVEIRSD